jgi:hypothetical protein
MHIIFISLLDFKLQRMMPNDTIWPALENDTIHHPVTMHAARMGAPRVG